MKSRSIFLYISLLYCSSFGQKHDLGLKFGANYSSTSDGSLYDKIWCPRVGLTYNYTFPGKLVFGTELAFDQLGYQYTEYLPDGLLNSGGIYVTTRNTYNYLSVPLKIGYTFGDRLYGFANIGCNTGFLLKEKTYYSAMVEFSAILEAGFGYHFKSGLSIYYSSFWHQGLTYFNNLTSTISNKKLLCLNFSLGIAYELKKTN